MRVCGVQSESKRKHMIQIEVQHLQDIEWSS